MPAYHSAGRDDIAAALGTIDSSTPVSEVTRRLLELFTGGSIEPGTRLPPERQIATTLGVGRSAVREALAALEVLGIVDVRPGSGTYLRGTASELLPKSLSWGLLLGRQSTDELLEVRAGLEIYVARLAATRQDAAALKNLAKPLERTASSLHELTAFARADREFHDALAAAAENSLLVDLLQVVRNLLRVYADRAVRTEEDAGIAHTEHEVIFTAVQKGDADGAASAMAAHMATAARRLSGSQAAGDPADAETMP